MLGLQRGERGNAAVESGGKKRGKGGEKKRGKGGEEKRGKEEGGEAEEGNLPPSSPLLTPKRATATRDTVLVKPNLETDL